MLFLIGNLFETLYKGKYSVLTRLDEECELLMLEEWLDVAEGGRGPEP